MCVVFVFRIQTIFGPDPNFQHIQTESGSGNGPSPDPVQTESGSGNRPSPDPVTDLIFVIEFITYGYFTVYVYEIVPKRTIFTQFYYFQNVYTRKVNITFRVVLQ
jgi:hypothetical protein